MQWKVAGEKYSITATDGATTGSPAGHLSWLLASPQRLLCKCTYIILSVPTLIHHFCFKLFPLLWLYGKRPYFYGYRLIIIESLIFVAHHIYFYIILYMKLQMYNNATHLFLCSQSWKTRKVNDNQPCNDYAHSALHTLQPGIPHLPGTWYMVDLLHARCSSYRTVFVL